MEWTKSTSSKKINGIKSRIAKIDSFERIEKVDIIDSIDKIDKLSDQRKIAKSQRQNNCCSNSRNCEIRMNTISQNRQK